VVVGVGDPEVPLCRHPFRSSSLLRDPNTREEIRRQSRFAPKCRHVPGENEATHGLSIRGSSSPSCLFPGTCPDRRPPTVSADPGTRPRSASWGKTLPRGAWVPLCERYGVGPQPKHGARENNHFQVRRFASSVLLRFCRWRHLDTLEHHYGPRHTRFSSHVFTAVSDRHPQGQPCPPLWAFTGKVPDGEGNYRTPGDSCRTITGDRAGTRETSPSPGLRIVGNRLCERTGDPAVSVFSNGTQEPGP
jgi:hypothetical protein